MTQPSAPSSRWPLIIVMVIFVVITLLFVMVFVVETASEIESRAEATSELQSDTYAATVAGLLNESDAANGAKLVEQYGCATCHRLAIVANVAPSFSGLAERAGERRPPLSAADYIYESIIDPSAYLVEGYSPSMPQDFAERLSDQEIGDIIAYLLSPDAR
jgi:cytochrome c551/c552